ncbi:tellurite resistance TerB family protein [Cyanobium sp. AMD-g]|uniref:tellurite resistance TerB family protein n=1 Tax=Cyanobium sp. AMD-g TaxID=2823699 RepID=UPI0020CC4A46|nr:tellurite resistance TerB family protein [Cyanobium sp. AMD-g]MCP9929989.1 tellurite resistance TerB family protein [Cyanobium sp. AMD-g]
MNPSEAFAAIGLAAVACDGALDADEAAMLRQLLEVRSPYSNLGEAVMGAMFDGLLGRLRTGGWETLLMEAAPELTPVQQETAYAMAALLVHTNRSFKPVEQQMLKRLGELISVPADRCSQILEVMAVLHRDSLRT